MQKLPAVVKARAAGGTAQPNAAISSVLSSSLDDPGRHLRRAADAAPGAREPPQLRAARRRTAGSAGGATPVDLAGATAGSPARFGGRPDPFTGEPASIRASTSATDKGQPVYATADGTVDSAAYTGDYGNLIVAAARLRAGDPLRTPQPVQRQARPVGEARRHHRLCRLDRPLDRRAPALRDPRQRQADQPAAAPHADQTLAIGD